MSTESWLQQISRLSVRQDFQQIVARARDHLSELDATSLGLVGRAAIQCGDAWLLDRVADQLRAVAPASEETNHIALAAAVTAGRRGEVATVQREIGDYASLVNQPVLRDAARMHLRAFAQHDLDDLVGRIATACEQVPAVFLRCQAALRLRHRVFAEAIPLASDAFDASSGEDRVLSGVLLARCYERAGQLDKAATTYRQVLWHHPPHPRFHYRAALTALAAKKVPMARRMMQRATNGGASGPWLEWVRGYVQLRFQSPRKAQQTFKVLCEKDPENVAFAMAWLDAFDSHAKPSATLQWVDDLLSRLDHPDLRARRVELLQVLGRGDEAVSVLRDAIEAFPDSPKLREIEARLGSRAIAADRETAQDDGQTTPLHSRDTDASTTLATSVEPPPVSEWPADFQPQWTSRDLKGSASFLKGLLIQLRVTQALMLREIRTEHGRAKLGYIWAFVEPMLHMTLFYLLWSFRGNKALDGLPLELFLVTGFIPWFLFSQSYGKCVGAVKDNSSMLAHATVTPFDLLLVKAGLEFFSKVTVFVILLFGLWLFGVEFQIHNVAVIMTVFLMCWVLGTGLGFTIEAFSSVLLTLPRVFSRFVRLLYFTSGVMFPVATMPPSVQEMLFWNPLVHLITHVRFAFLASEPMDGITLAYPALFMVTLLTFGMIAMRALQRRVTAP